MKNEQGEEVITRKSEFLTICRTTSITVDVYFSLPTWDKISQLSCMKGIVLCPLKDVYFYWTFWLACDVPWLISSQPFSILRAHHSYPVHVPEPLPWPGVDSSFFANYWHAQSKLKLRVFVSQPLQNFWANRASFLNHFKQHWVQQRLTSFLSPLFWMNFTAWTVCSVLLKADCCYWQCDCFT